jgi:hypothetical protein
VPPHVDDDDDTKKKRKKRTTRGEEGRQQGTERMERDRRSVLPRTIENASAHTTTPPHVAVVVPPSRRSHPDPIHRYISRYAMMMMIRTCVPHTHTYIAYGIVSRWTHVHGRMMVEDSIESTPTAPMAIRGETSCHDDDDDDDDDDGTRGPPPHHP